MPTKPKGSRKTLTLSFRDETATKGQERAKSLGLFFSQYVGLLIENDSNRGGDLTLKERPSAPDVGDVINSKKGAAKRARTNKP